MCATKGGSCLHEYPWIVFLNSQPWLLDDYPHARDVFTIAHVKRYSRPFLAHCFQQQTLPRLFCCLSFTRRRAGRKRFKFKNSCRPWPRRIKQRRCIQFCRFCGKRQEHGTLWIPGFIQRFSASALSLTEGPPEICNCWFINPIWYIHSA